MTVSAQVSTDMYQVHPHADGRKTQGQYQHKFPQTWTKFTHQLRAGKHKDSISTSFHRHGSSSHTNERKENTRTTTAEVCAGLIQIQKPTERRKTQGKHKHKFPEAGNILTQNIRAVKQEQ